MSLTFLGFITLNNMLLCPLCGDVQTATLSQLLSHIRLTHADSPHFLIQRNLQGCKRTFRKFTVYRNHVYSYHDTENGSDLVVDPVEEESWLDDGGKAIMFYSTSGTPFLNRL
jgi:hypothetical protein